MKLWLEFAAAAALAAGGTAIFRPIARRVGAVATPRADRWHVGRTVPRLSGPALLLALWPWLAPATFSVLVAFCAAGVWDDVAPMRPALKALVLAAPSALAGFVFGDASIAVACWVSANALNMLDHADGIAASAAGGSLLAAGGAAGLAGAGACAGFLVHNWPPARAFLGDGGSLMVGALLPLAWQGHGALPMLAGLAVPTLDAAYAVTQRVRAGRPPWQGGTDHTGHRLLRAGVRPAWLPVLYGGTALLLGLCGAALA